MSGRSNVDYAVKSGSVCMWQAFKGDNFLNVLEH